MNAIDTLERGQLVERPPIKPGDTVKVHVKVREGDKERIQVFEGHGDRHAPRRAALDLHGAQGVVRPGGRADLPAATRRSSTGSTCSAPRASAAPSCISSRQLKGKAARMHEQRRPA